MSVNECVDPAASRPNDTAKKVIGLGRGKGLNKAFSSNNNNNASGFGSQNAVGYGNLNQCGDGFDRGSKNGGGFCNGVQGGGNLGSQDGCGFGDGDQNRGGFGSQEGGSFGNGRQNVGDRFCNNRGSGNRSKFGNKQAEYSSHEDGNAFEDASDDFSGSMTITHGSDNFSGGRIATGSFRGKRGNRGSGIAGTSACHKCGQDGHFARECQNDNSWYSDSSRRDSAFIKDMKCYKCGEVGHAARVCPDNENGGEAGFSKRGGNAGNSGRGQRGYGRLPGGHQVDGGFRSDFSDHVDTDCNNALSVGTDFKSSQDFRRDQSGNSHNSGCRKCGEEGHFARDCNNAAENVQGKKPTEVYIPPDLGDEDSLFKTGIHQGINFDKYDNIAVEMSGSRRTLPVDTFEEMGLLPTFLSNVKRAGYMKPTPIQKYAIPAIMAGRDLMACAQTGSGKTAAFILPVLTAIVKRGLMSGKLASVQEPQALVIAPTRELAVQIFYEAKKFSCNTDVRPVVVYGGADMRHQISQIERGANVVVGTPGRLLDFIKRGRISIGKVQFLILDEADRMLDMGFEPAIRQLVETLGLPANTDRQTLMFSATFKPDIQKLAGDFLNQYLFITVGIVGGACSDVEQTFLEVDRFEKRDRLCSILTSMGSKKVLVFVGQKRSADFLATYLCTAQFPATSIHGDRYQSQREQALRDFKSGTASILIATNVAARGLDIPRVLHVVNYDLPSDIDEYVHRIGRTGRCGNLGTATSFYSHDTDAALAGSLVKVLAESQQEVPEWLAHYAESGYECNVGRSNGRFASKDIRHNRDYYCYARLLTASPAHRGQCGVETDTVNFTAASGHGDFEVVTDVMNRDTVDDEAWD